MILKHRTAIHWAPTARPGRGEPVPEAFGDRRARVLLVEDQHFVLDATTRVVDRQPDLTIVGTAGSVAELAELAAHGRVRPDVVVLDYALPDGTGLDACRIAKAAWPDARIVMLTGVDEPNLLVNAIEAGADGFLHKGESVKTVLAMIRAAAARELLVTPAVVGEIARRLATVTPQQVLLTPLTPRELTVLKALALGHSTVRIATDLGLSPGTVRVHVEAIRRKFQVSSRLEAVSAAVRHRIVEVPSA